MKKWIWIIFFIALFLRLYKLSDFPAGFTPDEASQGYTAYSILKTGRDEWGVRLPLAPRSFGDFKAPLQTYLMIPFIAVLGLNEFSVRLPNALLGSLAVLIVYFLVRSLRFSRINERLPAGKAGIHADLLPVVAAALLAISPWHISLSRGAFEANLTTFFLPLAVWLFLVGIRNSKFMILSSLIFGLNLFTYHSAKIITPLVAGLLTIGNLKELRQGFSKNIVIYVSSLILFIGFLGLLVQGQIQGGGARAGDIGIFSGGWENVSQERYFSVKMGLPDIVARSFNNKLTSVWGEFIKNYFSYLSPYFLFAQGAGESTYGMIPGYGVLYFFEILFILVALYYSLHKNIGLSIILFWILLSPLPASLARGVGYHANRVAVMMPAIQILSAYGAINFFEWSKVHFKKNFTIVRLLYCCIIVFSLTFFLEKYFFYAPGISAPKMGYGWNQTSSLLKNNDASRVIISRSLSEPQIYMMFFQKLDPGLVQNDSKNWLRYEKEGLHFVDQLGEYSAGKYVFRNFSFPEDWQKEGIILLGSEKDFLGQEKMINELELTGTIKSQKTIYYPDSQVAFRIFSL